MSNRTKAYLLLFVATVIWGVAGPVIKYTEGYISPLVFLLYRLAIAAAFGAVALSLTRKQNWPKSFGQKLGILVYAFFTTTIGLGLLFLGYEKTSALTASVLSAFYPIMVAIVGMIFLHERITRRENIGMGIALLGTAVVTLQPFFGSTASSSSTLLGNLLVVGSILIGVAAALFTKILLRHTISPSALTHISFIVGFLTLAPVVLYLYPVAEIIRQIVTAPLSAHLGVVYMALVSGTLAYILWDAGQRTIEIGESAMFNYLYPVITLPLSIFWLHEEISLSLIIGTIVVGLGVIIAETKTNHKKLIKYKRR